MSNVWPDTPDTNIAVGPTIPGIPSGGAFGWSLTEDSFYDTTTHVLNQVTLSTASFGALSNRTLITDGVISSSSLSTLLAPTSLPFSRASIGQQIHIPGGGTSTGITATLTSALTLGTAAATLAVTALSVQLLGQMFAAVVWDPTNTHNQVFRVYGNTASGATSVVVAQQVTGVDTPFANFSYPIGSTVTFTADLFTTIIGFTNSGQAILSTPTSVPLSNIPIAFGTDDSAAIQAALTAASKAGGGTVIHRGSSVLAGNGLGQFGALLTYNKVRLVGVGEGATVLYPFGPRAAIGDRTASTGSPRTNWGMANLTIDCSHQQSTTYSVDYCGIRLPYNAGCTYEDLTVQYALATGVGTDFGTVGTSGRNIKAMFNGRQYNPILGGGGCSGIGIGTGGYTVEVQSWTDCVCNGNGQYGLFFETQNTTHSLGIRVVNCYASGNHIGFGDSGCSGAIFNGCTSYANVAAGGTGGIGFSVDTGTINAIPGDHTTFIGCHALAEPTAGFEFIGQSTSTGGGWITLKSCKFWGNTGHGVAISVPTGLTLTGFTVEDCDMLFNGGAGIVCIGPGTITDLFIQDNRFDGNGQVSATSKSAIRNVSCPITKFVITGNKMWDDGGPQKQTYALENDAGNTMTTGVIDGNDMRGNLTGTLSNAGTFANDVVFRDNPGYNPVGSAVPCTAFAIGTTTVPATNNTGVDGTLYVTAAGTVTGVSVNGVAVSGTLAVGDTYRILAGGTFTWTGGGAPTVVFVGD